MQTLTIPVELAQAILTYLAKQPYIEVAKMIDGIQSIPPNPLPEPVKE